MKRLHVVITLFIAALLNLGVSDGQAATLAIDMVPGGGVDASRTLAPGDSFTVDVLVDGALDLAGFQFDVLFDPAILSATSIASGDLFGLDTFPVASAIDNILGSLSFAETTLALAGIDVSASAVLASIQFMVLAEGASTLDLMNIELVDSVAVLIDVSSAAGGQLTARQPSGVPEPGTLSLLWMGLGALAIFRRRVVG